MIQTALNKSRYTVKSRENKNDDLTPDIKLEITTTRNLRKYWQRTQKSKERLTPR